MSLGAQLFKHFPSNQRSYEVSINWVRKVIESKGNVNFAACKDPALTVKYLQYCLAQFLIDVFSQCKAITEGYEFMISSMTFLLTPTPP